jgi:hypothetical protein
MIDNYTVGDLVHIPQSVQLIDCKVGPDEQLTIPLRVTQTTLPTIGVVTEITTLGYLQVYCEGVHWAVKPQNVFRVERVH